MARANTDMRNGAVKLKVRCLGTPLGSSKERVTIALRETSWWISPGRKCPSQGSCGNLLSAAVPSTGRSEQGAALGVCYSPRWVNLCWETPHLPTKPSRRLAALPCFTAHGPLEHRSPAGGQNTLLTLAAALNSVQGSKRLRERKPYMHPWCSLALLPLTPVCGPVLRWQKSFPHPSPSL